MNLTERWSNLDQAKPIHNAYWECESRFIVVAAGRRSYKTEIAKRKAIKRLLLKDGNYFAGAPTREQAKRIFWQDFKDLIPRAWIKRINESNLTIEVVNGSKLTVMGMDKPERVEGSMWHGGLLDEIANMKAHTWDNHVRPALSDTQGWCIFTGVPEGRNFFERIFSNAKDPSQDDWKAFEWTSEIVLSPKEIAAVKKDLDPLTYAQEYLGSFVDFQGRAYHSFDVSENCRALEYDPKADLILCFDFNVSPGVAAIIQEQEIDGVMSTCVIDEVFIPKNSNTERVCTKIIQDWSYHTKNIYLYGDATGGSRKTSALSGSDWDIIWQMLASVFSGRLVQRVPKANPSERSRINAVNSRSCSMSGERRLFVDPVKAPKTKDDFEGSSVLEGSGGQLDKSMNGPNKDFTHLTDAIGYYLEYEFPVRGREEAPRNITLPGARL